ncbi:MULTISPECIES: holo-ACP synthase [unclassified Spiroplasma]|uniref:holo-ACP synthase n=1 Tax=unclassified Spiroplasma TaxID=2637901 RepID=UPI0027E05CC3|nr:holo-ACP synthase [Spiroplasma sp. AdecLV25b]
MYSVGIDIVEITRVKNHLEFVKRILSPEEIKLYHEQSSMRQQEFLAGRWALKEAIFKALPQEKLIFHNINISYNEWQQPEVVIKDYKLLLSLSHNQTSAIAIAIVI